MVKPQLSTTIYKENIEKKLKIMKKIKFLKTNEKTRNPAKTKILKRNRLKTSDSSLVSSNIWQHSYKYCYPSYFLVIVRFSWL